jgi:FHS family L-fucose permease-like MFS transporter
MFGFLTCLNDVLIPDLKSMFDLSYSKVMLVQFCFFLAYFVGSIPFGRLVHIIGFKTGIFAGLCVAGIGAALFYPASSWHSFPIFLVAFFILALGITLLQVAANPYVAHLGPQKSSESRLTLVQAFSSLGTTLAPLGGSFFLLNGGWHRLSHSAAIQGTYLFFSVLLFALAFFLPFPEPSLGETNEQKSVKRDAVGHKLGRRKALRSRHLLLGVIGIFAYVGGEVCIGSFLVSFLLDPAIAGFPASIAAQYVSLYWGGAMVGRFLGSWIMTWVPPTRVLAFNGSMAALLVIVSLCSTGQVAMISILAVGLFNSIMFPTIFSLAIQKMGDYVADASGLLCTAIVGGAVLPLLQGILADYIGVHYAFVVPVFCYLYVVFYAIYGSRVVSEKSDLIQVDLVPLDLTREGVQPNLIQLPLAVESYDPIL